MKKVKKDVYIAHFEHLDFLSKGLACHALCLLEQAGVLDIVRKEGAIQQKSLHSFKNPALIRAALVTLVGAGVFAITKNAYHLTELGKKLERNIGVIYLPLVGYRHLIAKQFELLSNPTDWKESDVDHSAIALSSINFGLYDLDPAILEIFRIIRPKGTICDLGCGTAEKLVKICQELNVAGLGIEKDSQVIEESQKFTKTCSKVEIFQGDITNLTGIWEDVDVALLSMVYHDVIPTKSSIEFLQSLCVHFPRLRCLIIADIVSMSTNCPTIMPGFDYVHGLQGVIPRTYEDTIKTFTDANFTLVREVLVPNMPNMFIWVIEPNK